MHFICRYRDYNHRSVGSLQLRIECIIITLKLVVKYYQISNLKASSNISSFKVYKSLR